MKRLPSLVLIMFMISLFPTAAFAVDYSIEKMDINAELHKNGNVQVTEEQTYKFDSKFKGITRTLIPKEGTKIINVEAHENNETLKVEQTDNEYRIHRKGKKEIMTIELTYLIEDAVSVYSDIAEFYWPFFDTSNESDYEQFEVTVHPPNTTDDVIAFGYDSAVDSGEIQENGDVQFNLGHVPSGEKGNIRVAYDADLFPAASSTKDVLMREDIVAEHQQLINERILFEKRQNNLNSVAPYIIGLLAIMFISLLFSACQKKQAVKNEVNRKYPLPYFVPKEIMSLPATIFYKKSDMVPPEVLSAALMNLLRKGYIEETGDDSFKVVSRKTNHNHELLLINWLFDEIGHDGIFKAEDLKSYTKIKQNQKTYQKDYLKWQKAVREEKGMYDLFAKNTKIRITGVMGLLIVPLIIFLAMYELFMLLTFAIFLALGFFAFGALYKTRTVLGARITRDWQVFQDKYPELDDEEWAELVTDDQKRAFIYGIAIKDKKIEQKNKELLMRYPKESYTTAQPVYFLMVATIANSGFNDAQKTSASSSSSAGGGTGVGGGGGGSGAF